MNKQIVQQTHKMHFEDTVEELFLLCAVGLVLFWLGWMFGQRSDSSPNSQHSIQVEHKEIDAETFGRFGRRTATQP